MSQNKMDPSSALSGPISEIPPDVQTLLDRVDALLARAQQEMGPVPELTPDQREELYAQNMLALRQRRSQRQA
jgi:hypothetical protein